MATMGPILLPVLMLLAEGYCAPGSWIDIGGSLGYESRVNGTIGGSLKADRDGLSVNGTGRGIIGASWAPTLIARGHARLGDKVIAGDASMKTVIDNSWQPGFQGEIGHNSNGTWLLGFNPDSQLYNKLLFTPNVQVKTGDDARKLVGLPLAPRSENQNEATQQGLINGAASPYASAYPYGYNPYGFNPYTSFANGPINPYVYMQNPYTAYDNMAPGANGAPNPYAAYYAQAMAQSQLAQSQKAQSQFPEQPIEVVQV